MRRWFPDQAQLYQDPRGEDPLVYYLAQPDGWEEAIGFLIEPEYQEWALQAVSVNVFPAHQNRLQALTDSGIRLVLERLASTLTEWFPHWRQLTLRWPGWLVIRLRPEALIAPYVAAGWTTTDSPDSNHQVLTRNTK